MLTLILYSVLLLRGESRTIAVYSDRAVVYYSPPS